MTKTPGEDSPARAPGETLPDEAIERIAAEYLAGTIEDQGYPPVPGIVGKTVRALERPEPLPRLPDALLRVGHYRHETRKQVELTFEYVVRKGDTEALIAEMDLAAEGETEFDLYHRWVGESWRRGIVPGKILGRAESFVQALANARGAELAIVADVSEMDTLKWLRKLGYEPALEQDRAIIDEMAAHPEHFEVRPVESDGGKKLVIYRRQIERVEPEKITVTLRKAFPPA